jgi:hypothetical protein
MENALRALVAVLYVKFGVAPWLLQWNVVASGVVKGKETKMDMRIVDLKWFAVRSLILERHLTSFAGSVETVDPFIELLFQCLHLDGRVRAFGGNDSLRQGMKGFDVYR